MIQEFDISITAVGDDRYLVRTENVASGVPIAEEQVYWPVRQWLEQSQRLMHDPLLGLLQGQSLRQSQPTGAAPLRAGTAEGSLFALGQELYNSLFQGLLRDSWLAAQGVAQNRQNLLRLRLGIKDAFLQRLPWEILRSGDRPLATGTDVAFSRYDTDLLQGRQSATLLVPDFSQPLRILMVVASPEDQARLELLQEVHQLQTELTPMGHFRSGPEGSNGSRLQQPLDVRLTLLEQPGRAELTQALEQEDYQVLHYAGHSNLGDTGGDLFLVSRQTGLTERLSGEDLAGLLVNNGIKLAVFNSCRGAYSSSQASEPGWQEQNLAQALLGRGVPSVIAMAERIPDGVAIAFTRLLYRNLKQRYPIDLSLNRTRQGLISAYGSDQFYWALPILYMQPSFDGYLASRAGSQRESWADPFEAIFADSEPHWEGARSHLLPLVVDETSEPPTAADELDQAMDMATELEALESLETIERLDAESIEPPVPELDFLDEADINNLVKRLEQSGPEPRLPNFGAQAEGTDHLSEIIQQLSQSVPAEEMMPVQPDELLLPEALDLSEQELYDPLFEEPVSEESPTPAAADHTTVDKTTTAFAAAEATDRPAGTARPTPLRAVLGGSVQPRRRRLALMTIGAVAVATALAAVGLTAVLNRADRPTAETQALLDGITAPSTQEALGQVQLSLINNDLDAAAIAVNTLIRQNQPAAALTMLMSATPEQKADPILAFLTGRAQWTLVKQGVREYSPADALRSWQTAIRAESDWMEIWTALGFAQYAVNDFDRAAESWQQAIRLAEQRPATESVALFGPRPSQYILNAYAGLAMANLKLAEIEFEAEERAALYEEAVESYLKVFTEAPLAFQPQELGNNWLWLEPAIDDWRAAETQLAPYLPAENPFESP